MLSKEKIKELSKLKTKKGRDQQGRFLIEGLRLCEEVADSQWLIESVLFTHSFEEKTRGMHRMVHTRGEKLLNRMQQLAVKMIPLKNHDLAKLSDTVTAPGIMCVVKTKKYPIEDLLKKNLKLILALDGVRDPGNVGTLIRTADAFGIDGIILSDDTVELYNPKLVRSTMGSIFHLPILDEVNLEKTIPELKKKRFKIVGTDVKEGKSLEKLEYSDKICILLGNEVEGLNRDLLKLSDQIVHIPVYGKAESLNVAVAGGILLHEIARKRMLNPKS
jgi:TrmH family RNA methyltransferase